MKALLISSLVLSTIAIFGLLYIQPEQANAVPVSYNLTALNIPFSTFTPNATSTAFQGTLFVESGYNGTVTSIYEAHSANNKVYYKLGYHPTLPVVLDAFNNITASASVAATQSLPITVPTGNNNVVLVVGISFDHTINTDHNKARMSSVKIGSTAFTLALNKTVTCTAAACDSEIWYLYNPPTGANTITITPAEVTTYHMVAGVYSFHNLRGLTPVSATSSGTGTSVTPTLNITPTYAGNSWILDNLFSLQTTSPSASSNTREWIGKTAAIMGASQFNNNPTISGSNTLSWTTTNVLWANTAVEMVPIQDQTTFNFYLANMPNQASNLYKFSTNASKIYYVYGTGALASVNHLDTTTGVESHDFGIQWGGGTTVTTFGTFITLTKILGYAATNNGATTGGYVISPGGVNQTIASLQAAITQTDQVFKTPNGLNIMYENSNQTTTTGTVTTSCLVNLNNRTTDTPIDANVCLYNLPAHVNKFWYGMRIYNMGNYYSNSTLPFFTTINALPNTYKTALTIPSTIYGLSNADVRMVAHLSNVDYFMSYDGTTVKYIDMPQLTHLLAENRALQSFLIINPTTTGNLEFSPTSANPSTKYSVKLYSNTGVNTTVNIFGMFSLPSGFTTRLDTNNEHDVRTIDPRWTNLPSQNYPAIYSTGSLFPIDLTVSNAPTDASLMVTSQSQTINNLSAIWSLVTLDTSHTAEFDLPPNQCVNLYVADNSVYPLVYSYQGNVCATGVNQKTVYYTNTLPTTFYTMKYGATSTYTPSSNALSTTVRSTTAPFTYNVIIRNSTGSITTNSTFTVNSTSDTQSFNVSSTAKPGALFISVPGTGTIYSTYLGSALSFASTMSFFHQYFSYQGFDLLSFIPIIFASMFTRNTVGLGMAMVTVLIATLSFLSVVVISDATMAIIVVISLIGLIGYRGLYG